MVDRSMPHEEPKKVWCPRLCPLNKVFPCPCIEDPELTEPKAIEYFCYDCNKKTTPNIKEVISIATKSLPANHKFEGCVVSPGHIQIYYSDNFCPLFDFRKTLGDNEFKNITSAKLDKDLLDPTLYKITYTINNNTTSTKMDTMVSPMVTSLTGISADTSSGETKPFLLKSQTSSKPILSNTTTFVFEIRDDKFVDFTSTLPSKLGATKVISKDETASLLK